MQACINGSAAGVKEAARSVRSSLARWASVAVFFGCVRGGAPAVVDPGAATADRIAAFREAALRPARLPPPSIDPEPRTAVSGPVRASARPVRAEEAEWNRWIDGPRLFNDRAALWFEVRVEGPEPLGWIPERSSVEINAPERSLAPAGSAEVLLGDLLVHALLEERLGLEGDLVERTRGAGAFRAAWLPPYGADGALAGLVAFPFDADTDPAVHVVALRLRLTVSAAGEEHALVFVFE